jgi:hypothetical protein
LVRRRLTFFQVPIDQEEFPELLEVRQAETTTEAECEVGGEPLEHAFPVLGPVRSALFALDDASSHLPVGCRHDHVHGPGRRMARVLEQLGDACQ